MPMSHSWETVNDTLMVEYKWKKEKWNLIRVNTEVGLSAIEAGSEEEFITEHFWGYTRIGVDKTSEYQVEHPRWEVYQTKDYLIDVDFEDIYGNDFAFLKAQKTISVFLAEGSEIVFKEGQHINRNLSRSNK